MSKIVNQYSRVRDIALHIKATASSENRETSVAEAIQVATAWLLASDRCGMHMHPEDDVDDVAWSVRPDADEQLAVRNAHDAVWDVIGPVNTHTNPRYNAAWEVWGIMVNGGESPGMGDK